MLLGFFKRNVILGKASLSLPVLKQYESDLPFPIKEEEDKKKRKKENQNQNQLNRSSRKEITTNSSKK